MVIVQPLHIPTVYPCLYLLTVGRLQNITLYGSNISDPTDPPSGWTNLSYYKGSDIYGPVAIMMLPEGSKVRHLSVMTAHEEGIITLKEVQVFSCPRKF